VNVVALAGGVGGAKLAAGLQRALPVGDLTVVVNTADDFDLWGLRICPDLDTVTYTLAGLANREQGWGVEDESFRMLSMLQRYGEDAWFKLGDRDLATHVLRTHLLRTGSTLSEATARLNSSLGVPSRVLPMADEPVSTVVETPEGPLEFQEYFVRRRQRDEVLGGRFRGIEDARPTIGVLEAVAEADAVILCPSNPIVSIGPILALPGMRDALLDSAAPKVAVSPIVGGRALKGPADRMLHSLGHEVSALGVARIYAGLVESFVIDNADRVLTGGVQALGMRAFVTDAVMREVGDRERLAREVLAFAGVGTS